VIYESKQSDLKTKVPQWDKPVMDKPLMDNPPPTNKEVPIKNEKKENSSQHSSDKPKKPTTPPPPDCDSVALSEASFRRVDLLFSLIKENHPKAKPPNREKWARDIDRLHRIDGYTYEQIDDLIRFSQEDDFWRTALLSAASLRKQAHQLTLKMRSSAPNKEVLQKNSAFKENKALAERAVDNLHEKATQNQCRIEAFHDRIEITFISATSQRAPFSLGYTELGFREQLSCGLRKHRLI